MEVWEAKVVSLCLLLALCLLAGLLAVHLVRVLSPRTSALRRSRAAFWLSFLNCVSGGVFLGTTLLHLLPDVRAGVAAALQRAGVHTEFAVAELLVSIGFFLVMAFEHMVMVCQHHHGHAPVQISSDTDTDHGPHGQEDAPLTGTPTVGYGSLKATDISKQDSETTALMADMIQKLQDKQNHPHASTHPRHAMPVLETADCTHIIVPSHHHDHHADVSTLSGVRAFVLFMALSVHTVLEGLALGLQTGLADTWNLLVAVSIHKCVMAWSLGVQLADSVTSSWRAWAFMVLFSLMAPVGIAVGTVVTETSAGGLDSEVASVTLQGLATGTFIYVTFFEVLHREVGQDHSLIKVLGVLLGYCIIALLNLFNGEHHAQTSP